MNSGVLLLYWTLALKAQCMLCKKSVTLCDHWEEASCTEYHFRYVGSSRDRVGKTGQYQKFIS